MSSRDQDVERALEARAQAIADRHRQAEARLVAMRATIERLRMEREATLAEFEALTHPAQPARPADDGQDVAAPVATPASAPVAVPPTEPVPSVMVEPGPAAMVEPDPAAAVELVPDAVIVAEPAAVPSPVQELTDEHGESLEQIDAAPHQPTVDSSPADTNPLPEIDGAAPAELSLPGIPAIADDESAPGPATPRGRASRFLGTVLVLVAAGAATYWMWWRPEPIRPSSSAALTERSSDPAVDSPRASSSSTPAPPGALGSPATDVPSARADTAPAGTTTAPGAGVQATTPTAAAPATRLRVELDASRNVWMRLLVDGETVSNRIVKQGEHLSLEAARLVEVRIGDAGAVRLTVNGEDRGLIGRAGQVLTQRITR